MSAPTGYVPLVEVIRSGAVESVHHGAAVMVSADGSIEWSVGDPAAMVYPRSANKPMQVLAMLGAGLELPADLLAIACASHSGETCHLEGVRRLLALGGLDETALANTPEQPDDPAARVERIRAGLGPSSITQNCSGKHAAMIVTCVVNGWPTESYLTSTHPLQRLISTTISQLVGRDELEFGVDGCGAPAHRLGLDELARCFGTIASGAAGPNARAVSDAMRARPDLVGGTLNPVTAFMKAVPGLLLKDGAEGVYAAALPDGRAAAFKIADGADRARPVTLAAVLAAWGIDVEPFREVWDRPVLGHGRVVGAIVAAEPLLGVKRVNR